MLYLSLACGNNVAGSHRLSGVHQQEGDVVMTADELLQLFHVPGACSRVTLEKFTGCPGMGMLMLNPLAFWGHTQRGGLLRQKDG